MRRVRSSSPEVRIEMAPLVDVVFLLLTFFVFAMVLMVRAEVLDVTLPTLGAGEPAESVAAVTITLDAEGRIYLDAEPIESAALIDALRVTLAAQPDAKINIAADTACPSGDLMGVIDLLSEGGFGAFQLFGTPEAGE